VHVIYNGFDPSDFTQPKVTAPDIFMIAHFGALNSDRDPKALWKALGMLSRENALFKEALKIRMIGQTDENIMAELEAEELDKQVELLPHMGHQEGVAWLSRACLLLLPLNDAPNAKGILPGKMYEYMALERPILAIGPEGSDCQSILQETQAGFYHGFDDVEGISQSIAIVFEKMQRGESVVKIENTEQFSRRNLAGKIIRLAEKQA
jgi:glycosyltransferase involved in cell wall biosynthesis